MAFGDPLQWVVIGIVVIIIFLWGPQKIPELARGLGRAKKEFDNAAKEFNNPTSASVQTPAVTAAPAKTADEIFLETAHQLGITTDGKTREQIAQEIVWKTKGA
jgi:sec-independent protein translocase protein TatA